MDITEIKERLLSASTPVMKIVELTAEQWYRKPAGPRRGPWNASKYEFLDEKLWQRREECIYFVQDGAGTLRYVGISLNRLADRWRVSPAYGKDLTPLGRNELFHSQCWPAICANHRLDAISGYTVSVIHGKKLQGILSELSHPLSCLGRMEDDPDIAVIALEVWFVKRFESQLWNKRK